MPPGLPERSRQESQVLGSLASLFDEQGDVRQAITQERRALALCEQLPDPRDRAISHHNLAIYLERSGTPSALAESSRHQLAALVYRLVSGLGQDLQTSLHNYAIGFRRAHAAGTPLVVPRVAELLADPAFRPLEEWLRHARPTWPRCRPPWIGSWRRPGRRRMEQRVSPRDPHRHGYTSSSPGTARRTAHGTRSRRPRRGSRRATELERAILQRLATEAADLAALERRVRA